MPAYMVTYDLVKQGQNYEGIIKKLRSYQYHWPVQQSVWIVSSTQTESQIRDFLATSLDENDKLVVVQIVSAAWKGYDQRVESWMKHVLS